MPVIYREGARQKSDIQGFGSPADTLTMGGDWAPQEQRRLNKLMTAGMTQRALDATLRREVRLLVVDDHLDHYEQIVEFAEMYHPEFKVECKLATTPADAVSLASSWKASVVLVDLHAISSALELLQQLSHQGSAVIATSDNMLPELSETASQYGAVGYLSKSSNPDDIEVLLSFAASVSSPSRPAQ